MTRASFVPARLDSVDHAPRFPELGGELPKRGNRFSTVAGRLALALAGWGFEGQLPNRRKAVLIVAPHTSNWDFLVGVAAVFALGVRVSFLGKHTIFRRPFGPLMRWLGGIPVDRTASTGVVQQTVERFHAADELLLGLSPEGTRRKVSRWKTGFYYIALGAGVPIVPVALDYGRQTVRFGAELTPSGDLATDIRLLEAFFATASGRRSRGQ